MKRTLASLAIAAAAFAATTASATTDPNSAIFVLRIFNDCAFSNITTTNTYPSLLQIAETDLNCGGFANLHAWRFSTDGVNQELFPNNSAFRYAATVVLSGTVEGEGGLQIAPWWNQDEGRFNIRTSDGEIACFGGRLPFYSFTANGVPAYVKGTPIRLQITYLRNGLSQLDPATILYELDYQAVHYSSPVLAFDEGNPAEDPPHGLWGILNEAKVGGHVQPFLQAGNPNANFTASWSDISWENLKPISVDESSWGQLKGLYR
jgi:hypothetical protein